MLLVACQEDNSPSVESSEWVRHPQNPVFRDSIPFESYEAASDPHVFFDNQGQLWMIYSGDADENPGVISIKLAKGQDWDEWEEHASLLFETGPSGLGPSGLDISKETPFYRYSSDGKHQIYYIAYPDGETYASQIYLAESDNLVGPYVQYEAPVVPIGRIANREVEVITSPSVVEHEGVLYLLFLAWDSFANVSEVWVLGATSEDDGRTWSNFEEVNVPIGMEGQITKAPDGTFCSVRTGEFEGVESIFYATADHPFGPWREDEDPLIIKQGAPWEIDEAIAPQITFDPASGRPVLYYTGADYQNGWWIMLATETGWIE